MNVHVVTFDCGDFYCDRDHILGIFYSETAAQEAIDDAPNFWSNHPEEAPTTNTTNYGYSIGEWKVRGNLNKSEYKQECDRLGLPYIPAAVRE